MIARTHFDTRIICLADSQVQIGASARGRSSAGALNHEQRAQLGPCLGSDLYIGDVLARTAINPADDPTRHAALRRPDCTEPDWARCAKAGDFKVLDALLRA